MVKIKTVEMVRQIRDKQYLLTKDMSDRELMHYFKQKAKEVNEKMVELLKKQRE